MYKRNVVKSLFFSKIIENSLSIHHHHWTWPMIGYIFVFFLFSMCVYSHRSGRSWITTYTLCATPGGKYDPDGRRSCCSWVTYRYIYLSAEHSVLPTYKLHSPVDCVQSTYCLSAGYQNEVDALLSVNKQSRFSREQEHLGKARELLDQLMDSTSLFPPETGHPSRYLYVMVLTQTHTQANVCMAIFGRRDVQLFFCAD